MLENRVVIEVEVQGLTVRREVPRAWSGGNPVYHAKEARQVIDKVADEIDALIVTHYGDIRTRSDRPERLEAKNIRVEPEVWAKADAKAKAEGTNVSAVIRRLLAGWAA